MNPQIPQQTTSSNGCSSKDPANILKRKRTKRQRPTIPTHSSSPSSYSDEDTANCLILLSKGDHNINASPNNIIEEDFFDDHKFNSKRYIQTSTDDPTNGTYVYECKTCSRTFSSFQALGGHRASHNKPRINLFDKPKPPIMSFSIEDEPLKKNNNHSSSSNSSSLSLQQVNRKPSSLKVHECSICGAEFNSGQALGGHMRRHRATNGNTNTGSATNTTLSLIPYSHVIIDHNNNQKSMNDGLCLTLDLNLPAPTETVVSVSNQEQHRDSEFKFTANKQQPSVHLSTAPTLVDCHY